VYLLDTNVVSELRKAGTGRVEQSVVDWAGTVRSSELFLSAITILELEIGVLLVERRDIDQGIVLRRWLADHVLPAFRERILTFDTAVAQRCAQLHVPDPQPDRDSIIAATALVHDLTVVTRNTRDFGRSNVRLLNPWERS
jgi:predicted nucleic acid-binding protein